MGRGTNSVLYGDRQPVPGRERGPGVWVGVPRQSRGWFFPAPEIAIERLGLLPIAAMEVSRPSFELLLPVAAVSGYHQALRNAIDSGEVRRDHEHDQLQWLARELVVENPDRPGGWEKLREPWAEASKQSGTAPPNRLGFDARLELIEQLLSRPWNDRRLIDSLAAAFRVRS